jgi:cystathionine beta-lyase
MILFMMKKTGEYSPNFDELEKKITPKTKLWIFCHPHNPIGKVWSQQEMAQIENIVKKHDLSVISDEIHGFLNFPPFPYIPLASFSHELRQRTITIFSASKLSGIAGMFHAFAVTLNLEFQTKLQKQQERAGLIFYRQQVLGMVTSSAAYSNENKEWIKEEVAYIKKNRDFAIKFFKKNLPKVVVTPSQGTFLLWINFKNLPLSPQQTDDTIFKKAKVALSRGTTFGEQFNTFYRMNIGCPHNTLEKALIKINDAFKN